MNNVLCMDLITTYSPNKILTKFYQRFKVRFMLIIKKVRLNLFLPNFIKNKMISRINTTSLLFLILVLWVGSSDNENKLKDVSKAIFQSSAIDDELAKKER
jgi:hypothetical protein